MIARRNDANARFNSCICTTTTMAVRSVCSSPCTAALFSTFASGLSHYYYLDHLQLVYLLTHLPETTAACGRAIWLLSQGDRRSPIHLRLATIALRASLGRLTWVHASQTIVTA